MNIVLSGNFEWSGEDLDRLTDLGKNTIIRLKNEEDSLPIKESDVDAVICNWFFKYHFLENFINLKFIQLLSVGNNGIDTEIVQSKGITLYNAGGVYSIPISEFVISRLLSFYKEECYFLQKQREHKWIKLRSIEELYDKKILIIGTGSIGTEIARRIGAFTNEVYGCNRTIREISFFKNVFPLSSLKYIVSDYDVIILSIALTEATKYLINKEIINTIKPTAVIVNVSRGMIIDENALIQALTLNTIRGAILDVFENEPLAKDSPLWDMPNVLISPHNSFVSKRNHERLRTMIFRNLCAWEKQNGIK